MNDAYVELLVKRKSSVGPLIARNILIGIGSLIFLLGIFTGSLFLAFVLISGIFFGGAYLFHQHVSIEYEYLYLDKTLSVDRISNQAKRKKMAEYRMVDLELMAPVGSSRLKDVEGGQELKPVDFTSHMEDSEPYAMLVRKNGTLTKVLIECNDMLFQQIRQGAPRKVFKD